MTYAFKPGGNVPKSNKFTLAIDSKTYINIEKGSVIKHEGKRCEVVTVRKIEVGNGLIKVYGKCKPV